MTRSVQRKLFLGSDFGFRRSWRAESSCPFRSTASPRRRRGNPHTVALLSPLVTWRSRPWSTVRFDGPMSNGVVQVPDVRGSAPVSANRSWLAANEQAAWRAWLDMYRLLLPTFDRQLQSESRASFTDFEVLVHLSEAPDRRLRMSEIADRTISTRSAITRTVDRLAAREWVRRVRSTADQRGYYAELTDLGADVLAEIAPGHVAVVRECLIDLLSDAELTALQDIGDKVRRHLANHASATP